MIIPSIALAKYLSDTTRMPMISQMHPTPIMRSLCVSSHGTMPVAGNCTSRNKCRWNDSYAWLRTMAETLMEHGGGGGDERVRTEDVEQERCPVRKIQRIGVSWNLAIFFV